MGRKKQVILGLMVSLALGYFAFRGTDLSRVLAAASTVQFLPLIPITAVLLLGFLLRAIRWKYMLAPVREISTHSLFSATMIGFMANNILPFRVGDVLRGYALARQENVTLGCSLATLFLERLLDGLTISLFMVLLLPLSLPEWLGHLNLVLVLVYVAGFFACLLFVCDTGRAMLTRHICAHLSPRIEHRIALVLNEIGDGFRVLRNSKRIVLIGLLSLIHWVTIALYYHLLLRACGIDAPFLASLVLLVIVSFGIMLPAAPGYIGNMQYFTVVALSLFAVPREQALGFSLVAHVSQFVPVTAIGLVYFFRQSIRLQSLWLGQPKEDFPEIVEGRN